MADPCFSNALIFMDKQYAFQTLRTLGYAVQRTPQTWVKCSRQGIAITEARRRELVPGVAQNPPSNRRKREMISWPGPRKISARQAFFKASNYYRTAEFFLHTHPEDPRIVSTWKKSREAFLKGAELADHPVTPIEIPFEGTTLPGYFCPRGRFRDQTAPVDGSLRF